MGGGHAYVMWGRAAAARLLHTTPLAEVTLCSVDGKLSSFLYSPFLGWLHSEMIPAAYD